jgi:hypothetical protein
MPDQEWKDKLMDQIAMREPKPSAASRNRRRTISTNFAPSLYLVVQSAARARGISMAAYIRRAAVAFAVYDGDLSWDETMADEAPVKGFAVDALPDPATAGGQGFGDWQIKDLS